MDWVQLVIGLIFKSEICEEAKKEIKYVHDTRGGGQGVGGWGGGGGGGGWHLISKVVEGCH